MPEASQNDLSLRELLVGDKPMKTLHHFKVGDVIFLDAKCFWMIYSGFVQVSTLQESGAATVLGLLAPLMPLSVRLDIENPYEVLALTDVELLNLDLQKIENSPKLLHSINFQMIRRLQQSEALLAIVSRKLVLDRIHCLLHFLAQEFGEQTSEGVRLNFRLTHDQIANMVGTTRVSTTRCLGLLRRQGIFTIGKDRHLYIQSL
jgi:CRP-like cAMP-binding protein